MDCGPPGFFVLGILQARILEWAVIPFSTGFSWPKDQTQASHIASRFFTVWTTRETHLKPLPVFKCVFLLLCFFFPPLCCLASWLPLNHNCYMARQCLVAALSPASPSTTHSGFSECWLLGCLRVSSPLPCNWRGWKGEWRHLLCCTMVFGGGDQV